MQSLFDHIDASRDQMLSRLVRWSSINSNTFNAVGLESMLEELRNAFAPLNATESTINLPDFSQLDSSAKCIKTPSGRALKLTKNPNASTRVLLNIHYDTVYPVDSQFQCSQQLDADTLNGPGVADAKGGIVVMLAALSALEAETPEDELRNFGWDVLLNPDEEIGSPGSANLLREAASNVKAAFVFEPALPDGSLVGARKGSGSFTVVIHGRAAHSGRDFASGCSATVALADFIVKIEASRAALGDGVIVNCGQITGGSSAINIVPDLAIARFNVRVNDATEMAHVETTFNQLVNEFNNRDGLRAELHGSFASPPKPLDAISQPLFDLAQRCGKQINRVGDLHIRSTGGTCDGNKLAACGIPVIDTLGPVGGEIHSPREYIRISSLTERAKLVAMMLSEIARGVLSDMK